jgi:hypothetical protein
MKKQVLDLYEKANKESIFNEAFAASKEYKKLLIEKNVDASQIENLTQVKILNGVYRPHRKAREKDPEFKQKQIKFIKNKSNHISKAGSDPGIRGLRNERNDPSLMASLVKIHNAQKAGMEN